MLEKRAEHDQLTQRLDQLAGDFIEEHRRGQAPTVDAYAAAHPELADEIRDLFPALLMMERVRPDSRDFAELGAEPVSIEETKLDRLGDFRILREVGRGGMGIVYEAEQISLGRHVALKVLPKHALLDSRYLRRFQNEARAAARLHHTNIVPVFGVGQHDGIHYYIMQFIQGVALDEILAELRAIREQSQEKTAADPTAFDSKTNHGRARSLAESMLDNLGPLAGRDSWSLGVDSEDPSQPDECGNGNVEFGKSFPIGDACDRANNKNLAQTLAGGNSLHRSDHRQSAYWKSVARLGAQVADALEHAHNHGVLHRDIKPANLLLDAQGTVWVADFGLARSDEKEDLTRTGDIVGTMRYMSPEQLEGKADARSDIYSLGVTLYELLTLTTPHDADDRARLIRQIFETTPRRPRAIDGRIPVDLETIVLKAISIAPSERYQQAAALAADLRRFLDDRPIEARRVTAGERAFRWCRRNPVVSTLSAVVLLLAIGLMASTIISNAVRRQRDVAIASQTRAEKAEAASQQMLSRAVAAERESSILAHLAKAKSFSQSRTVGQRTRPLDEIKQAAALGPAPAIAAELRNTAIEALSRPDLIDATTLSIPNQAGVQVDCRLTRYATVDLLGNRMLSIYERQGDQLLARVPVPNLSIWHATIDLTPDGQILIATYSLRDQRYEVLNVWDIQRQKLIVDQHVSCENVVSSIGVHPSGRYLAVPTVERDVAIWDLQELREIRRISCGSKPFAIRFDATGQRMVVSGYSVEMPAMIYDFESGARLFENLNTLCIGDVALSSNGKLVAFGYQHDTHTGNIIVWDANDHRVISVLEGHESLITDLQFLNRDDLLLSSSWDSTSRLWNARTGECLLAFQGRLLKLSESNAQIAIQNGNTLAVAELSLGDVQVPLCVPGGGNRADNLLPLNDVYDFNESGELAFGADSQGINIWDTTSGALIGRMPIGSISNILAHWAGNSLITVGDAGILRWPVARSDENGIVRWKIGPPRRLYQSELVRPRCAVWLNNQQQLAFSEWGSDRVKIIDADPTDGVEFPESHLPSDHQRINNLSASPDGRWLAAAGWKEASIQIWNVAQRSIAIRLPPSDGRSDTIFEAHFSPDGRQLVCSASNVDAPGLYFYETGSWKRLRSIPGIWGACITFSPDAKYICRQPVDSGVLELADGESGEEVARLQSPLRTFKPHIFSHDGRLLMYLINRNTLGIVRMSRLQELFAEMGLNWNLSFPPPVNERHRPNEVAVDCGTVKEELAKIADLRKARRLADVAMEADDAGNFDLAIQKHQQAIELAPDQAQLLNNLAWLLVSCPDSSRWDAKRALDLSRRAEVSQPNVAVYLNTLGVAQYRSGLWRDAIATLERAEQLDPQTYFGFNGFFVAMAHQQLGENDAAKSWFDRSAQWMDQSHDSDPELIRFRAEAEATLKAAPPADSKSDDP